MLGSPTTAPPDPQVKIWRYVDFTKFVDFVDSGSLYFSAAAHFEDPYEGSEPAANRFLRQHMVTEMLASSGRPEHAAAFNAEHAKILEGQRYWTYINCWHMNEREQAGMWKAYAANAVALTSTYAKLRACLLQGQAAREAGRHDVGISTVRYMDYDKDFMDDGMNFVLWPYVHKRKSFEHERELRAIIVGHPEHKTTEGMLDFARRDGPPGLHVPVDVGELVDSVYVAPSSPPWFLALVKRVLAKYALDNIEVINSRLSEKPIF